MAITLFHHPFTRASTAVWMLEEVGIDYALEYVDLNAGDHKRPEFLALNTMGKLPTLRDGDTVVAESAAIGLFLADRYAAGRLAPGLDDPERAAYLRWSVYAPSVIEPGCYAQSAKWEFGAAQAGWGRYDVMLDTIDQAIGEGPWLLGERFTMADVIFGGTLAFMVRFQMIDARPSVTGYVERLEGREARKRAVEINRRVVEERGLGR